MSKHSSHFLFLDFDGTLSPIVKNPAKAKMSPAIRKWIQKLAASQTWTLAVVSGRELKFIRNRVGLSTVIYAGNHGFEIKFPNKKLFVHPAAKKTKRIIAQITKELNAHLKKTPGIIIENKIWSATLHTRKATVSNEKKSHAVFKKILRKYLKTKRVRVTHGKKVMEVRPAAKWNKGEAIKFILKKMKGKHFPIYIGDDVTDEDAFKALKKTGWGIRVGRTKKTAAHTTLRSIKDMPRLLKTFYLAGFGGLPPHMQR